MSADALQIAKGTLGGLSIVMSALPIPEPFKSAVVGIPDAVLKMIAVVETARGNLEDAKALVVYVTNLVETAIHPLTPSHDTPATRERVERFHAYVFCSAHAEDRILIHSCEPSLLREIITELEGLTAKRSRWKRIFNYEGDAKQLGTMKQKVVEGIAWIQLVTVVTTGREVELITQTQGNIYEAQRLLSREQDIAFEQLKAMTKAQDSLYEGQQTMIRQQQLASSTEIARFIAALGTQDSGSSKKPPCLKGTRVSLLNRIKRWIEVRSDSGPRALCLKGSVGIGKSSIGSTIAEDQRASHQLGAEFYFTVDQQDRNEAVLVVLARQLASWSEGKLRFDIANAILEDPEITRRTPEVQFRQLIQAPLQALAGEPDSPTLVILLDGLDECNENYACRILQVLGESLVKLPTAVRVIITSRPEPHLLEFYTSEPMKSQLDIYLLDTEKVLHMKCDIEKYFKEELPRMVKKWVSGTSDWPGEDRRRMLVELSQGLWIYATTIARMLADSAIRNPEKQLQAVLSSHRDTDGDYGRNTHLDNIYSAILTRACPPNPNPALLTLFRDVLGTILVVQVPVNIHTLALLLCPHESNLHDYTQTIRTTVLAYLQAVLQIPGVGEASPARKEEPIHFIHKSFEDYLTDESRCDGRFWLNTSHYNRRMTVRCLTFPGFKRNICNLEPSCLNWVTDTFGSRVERHVSAGLQYACEQWPKHISREAPESDEVHALLETFTRTQLMYWIEVLSLLGRAGEIIGLVRLVESWLEARSSSMRILSEPVKSTEPSTPEVSHRPAQNVNRWQGSFPVGIHRQLQAFEAYAASYTAILHTDIRRHDSAKRLESLEQYAPDEEPASLTARGPPDLYPPIILLQELKCFINEFTMPISRSSPHIYFSALSFMPVHSPLFHFYGHMAEGGPCVRRGRLQRWSTSDDHDVPADRDFTAVREWSIGRPIKEVFLSQLHQFNCVAWSPNCKMIVSGTSDSTLQLWDASTRMSIQGALKGHIKPVWDVAWSPDSKSFVSASFDHTLRLWNASTGEPIGEALRGHTRGVTSVAWSPDGERIVSGSEDGDVHLWAVATGALISEALTGHHDERVTCVAWSPDGKTIFSASEDGTVHLWNTTTGALVGEVLKGQTGRVWNVAWSPDSKMIVTAGSEGNSLSIWNVSTGARIGEGLKGHIENVRCVSWSPDGKTIGSGSFDGTLRLWNASTQAPACKPLGLDLGIVSCVSWSPNSKTIISGSYNTLRFWDGSTGEPIRCGQRWPDSHTHSVYSLSFSPDLRHIVSASSDDTLRLWNVKTGALAQKPVTQHLKLSHVEFSPDSTCILLEDEEVRTVWDITGERDELVHCPLVRPLTEDLKILTIDRNGWLRDSEEKIMFWVPVVLRPVGCWGRVIVKENILAIEIPTVPIIDISACISKCP
ncbi:hypothetical protein FRB96_002793 [Tulasnella sp. 330]|nr:hypothetical protein FRB96_002793 [Tulasnella sp. 330]KAG8877955.1 hypothetical protein FRB97_002880 [Tulasnella sp. 331]